MQAQQDAEADGALGPHELETAIVIVRTARDARVVKRVRAELEAWPVRVIELGPTRELQGTALVELARAHDAEAVVRVHAPQRRVELWVARPIDAELGSLETITAEADVPGGDEILAVRVTEALRAWDIGAVDPVRAGAHAPPSVATQPTAAAGPTAPERRSDSPTETQEGEARAGDADPELPERDTADEDAEANEHGDDGSSAREPADGERAQGTAPSVWLELGPAITIGGSALSPELHALVSARAALGRRYSISALALLPVLGGDLDAPEGSARLTTWLLGAAADVHLELAPLTLGAGAGVAGVLARAFGEAPAPGLDAVDDAAPVVAPFARVSTRLELGARIGLCARGQLGAALPAVRVRVLDHDRARWGRPFVSASLSLDVAL